MSKNKRSRRDSYNSDMGNPQQPTSWGRGNNQNNTDVDNLTETLGGLNLNQTKKQKKGAQRELFPKHKP